MQKENKMERNVSLSEISDGRLYGWNDMVKADCGGCKGCAACCQGMGTSIILDPLDIYRLTSNTNTTFEQLLIDKIELNVVDGIILPNLKMAGPKEKCAFLYNQDRCSIHSIRPGICRIFPLGRVYENDGFQYILQVNECKKENKSKIKVRKWIDVPDLQENEGFINDWHYFIKKLQQLAKMSEDDNYVKQISMYILNMFYIKKYDTELSFYLQLKERLSEAQKIFK